MIKMARCSQHGMDFIREIFSPMVAVLTSEDAENVCRKNDLSFVELVRPFCQLSNEGMCSTSKPETNLGPTMQTEFVVGSV